MPSPTSYALAAELVFAAYSPLIAVSKSLQHLRPRNDDNIGSFDRPRHPMVVWQV